MPASLLDVNVWVAAIFTAHEFHANGMDALRFATRSQPAVFCRVTEHSFLRLITSPRLLAHYGAEGMTNRHALAALAGLKARPGVQFWNEPPSTAALWHRLAACDTASPKVWMDAYLAAFAITGNMRLLTLDQDFKNYEKYGLQLALLTS